MTSPNYPNNPTVGQTFNVGNITFRYDGEKWKSIAPANHENRITQNELDIVELSREHDFDTVAEMQAATDIVVGDNVILRDRLSSTWQVIAATTNNGWNVLDGTGSGVSLRLIIKSTLSTKEWGILHDNSSDNSTALQAMIDYGIANDIPIDIDVGTRARYFYTLNITGKLTVKGYGELNFHPQSSGQAGLLATGDEVELYDFKHSNTMASANSETIRFEDANDYKLYNLEVTGGHYGLSFANTVDDYTVNKNGSVANCSAISCTSSGFDFDQSSSLRLHGCRAEGCSTDGFKFRQSNKHATVTGNTAVGCGRDGFDTYDGLIESTLSNNTSEGNTLQGFEIKGTFDGTNYVTRGNCIANNVAINNGTDGFLVQSVRDCVFSGNQSISNALRGFHINEVQGTTFNGDTAQKNTQHGWLFTNASRCELNGCVAVNNSWVDGVTQNGTYHGFQLEAPADGLGFNGCRALNGLVTNQKGGQGYGINFVVGSAANRIIGGRYDDNVTGDFGGDKASQGFLMLDASLRPVFGDWTTNGDVAIQGYVTIVDQTGTTRKLATIA